MKQFFLPMIPPTVTHQQIGVNTKNPRHPIYEKDEVKAVRSKFHAALTPFRPDKPMEGGVRLVVKWCFPVTEGHRDGEYKLTKPDTDNLMKLFKDVMTQVGFWKDDAQVASEISEKFYARITGIWVRVEELQ